METTMVNSENNSNGVINWKNQHSSKFVIISHCSLTYLNIDLMLVFQPLAYFGGFHSHGVSKMGLVYNGNYQSKMDDN